jgi:GTP-binding protein EngB required for normal cell division
MQSFFEATQTEKQRRVQVICRERVAALELAPDETLCFISHHQGGAGKEARFLKERLVDLLGTEQIFLDRDQKGQLNLNELLDHVKATRVLVLIQTKETLFRPFVLGEVITALEAGIPIVPVVIRNGGYEFSKAAEFVSSSDFREALNRDSLGCVEVLEKQGLNLSQAASWLKSSLPQLISIELDMNTTAKRMDVMIEEIAEAILTAKKRCNLVDLLAPPRENYSLIVVGQTGSGKSTFLNYMCNFLRRGSLDELKVLIPTRYLSNNQWDSVPLSEADARDISSSQTARCVPYNFTLGDSKITIIDTPGYGDTRGVWQDNANMRLIVEKCRETKDLRAIIFVINGSLARVDHLTRQFLVTISECLPDALLDNVVVVFTNVTRLTCNFPSSVIEQHLLKGRKLKQTFYMQNIIFSHNLDVVLTDATERTEIEIYWNRSMQTLVEIVGFTNGLQNLPNKSFDKMHKTLFLQNTENAGEVGRSEFSEKEVDGVAETRESGDHNHEKNAEEQGRENTDCRLM